MISYLGVSIDELLDIFDASFAFSDNRPDRELVLPIEVSEFEGEDAEAEADALEASDDEMEDDEDELSDIFVDDAGQLHAYGETVAFAAESAVEFLTDYILTDDVDADWLTLDQARGALLALRILLPELEEIPEVECAYSFEIARDGKTGFPCHIEMKSLDPETAGKAKLVATQESYKGVLRDSTALVELFAEAGIPEDDRSLLADVLTEGILTLAEEQCGIILDVKSFVTTLAQAAKELKFDEEELELQH